MQAEVTCMAPAAQAQRTRANGGTMLWKCCNRNILRIQPILVCGWRDLGETPDQHGKRTVVYLASHILTRERGFTGCEELSWADFG